MYIVLVLWLVTTAVRAVDMPGVQKCQQPLPGISPSTMAKEQKEVYYTITIDTKGDEVYQEDQTYILKLEAINATTHPFRKFMITVEDPRVDLSRYVERTDVGSLKTLQDDQKSKHSEVCNNTVVSTDNSEKKDFTVHWLSPKKNTIQKIRFRAKVALNDEEWYEGGNLTIVLEKNLKRPADRPPLDLNLNCSLCSEARYELTFTGAWSQGTHPLNFPKEPYSLSFGPLIGATHDQQFTLWERGKNAEPDLKMLAENGDVSLMESRIMNMTSEEGGTRTLLKGKLRLWDYLSEPMYSLLRVERTHHLFSIAVPMKPSPDWFLGTSDFELCGQDEWLDYAEVPMFPWDAGTRNGISYDSPTSVTNPPENVERVALGSFNKDSPFYQMNLDGLKKFATLEIKRLNVYPLPVEDCPGAEPPNPQIDDEMQERRK